MRPTVRPAGEHDLGELLRLDGLARDHLRERRGGQVLIAATVRHHPAEASLRADLDDADGHAVLVAEIDRCVVGYAVAELRSTSDGSRIAHIEELFVESEFRNVGVGRRLMNQLVDWAISHGAVGIDAQVLPGDRASKNFFESFGLVARAISVHRALDQEPAEADAATDPS